MCEVLSFSHTLVPKRQFQVAYLKYLLSSLTEQGLSGIVGRGVLQLKIGRENLGVRLLHDQCQGVQLSPFQAVVVFASPLHFCSQVLLQNLFLPDVPLVYTEQDAW